MRLCDACSDELNQNQIFDQSIVTRNNGVYNYTALYVHYIIRK